MPFSHCVFSTRCLYTCIRNRPQSVKAVTLVCSLSNIVHARFPDSQAAFGGGGLRFLLVGSFSRIAHTFLRTQAAVGGGGLRSLLASGGGKGLYAGALGNLVGVAPSTAVFISVYEPVKVCGEACGDVKVCVEGVEDVEVVQ